MSTHDLCIFRYAIAQELKKVTAELEILKITKERDLTVPERWQLSPNLFKMSREELMKEIDPWISLVSQTKYWSDKLEEIDKGEE
jgi:hypothetical protein